MVGRLARLLMCLASLDLGCCLVTLVTGANKGIGREIARKLGKTPGTTTILACRDVALGTAAADELRASGCEKVVVQRLDLTDASSIEEVARYVESEHGKLDILVNNAAICFNDPTLYGKVPHTPFEQQAGITVRTNFFGTLAVTTAMLPLLRLASSPRIVNVASAAGRLAILNSAELVNAFTSPDLTVPELEALMRSFVADVEAGEHRAKGWANTCYGMSKLGLIALTRVLAREEPAMLVSSADPGYCATDQNQNQGFVSAERGAQTPYLLATLPEDQLVSGRHWFEEREMSWSSS